MATTTYSTPMNTSLDADFRAWTKDISDNLQALGLTKTTDTGQINFTTVLRPAVANTAAGYEIYRFNDALQATAPVFFKIEYGIGSNANMPMMWVTVGTGTTGAGVINGINTGRQPVCYNRESMTPTQTTPFPVKMCVLPGYVMVCFRCNYTGSWGGGVHYTAPNTFGFFLIGRTVDQSNGANSGDGLCFYRYYGDSNAALGHVAYFLNFQTQKLLPSSGYIEQHNYVPFDITSSLVDGDIQLFRHFMPLPAVQHNLYICTYLGTEIAENISFPATLVGSTPRTYLSLGSCGSYSGANRNANHHNAVLFE